MESKSIFKGDYIWEFDGNCRKGTILFTVQISATGFFKKLQELINQLIGCYLRK